MTFVLTALGWSVSNHVSFPYFDKVLHFFGGMTVALALFFCASSIQLRTNGAWSIQKRILIALGVLASLGVGIAWEVLEHHVPFLTNYEPHSFTSMNTLTDILWDMIGGIGAGFLLLVRVK